MTMKRRMEILNKLSRNKDIGTRRRQREYKIFKFEKKENKGRKS